MNRELKGNFSTITGSRPGGLIAHIARVNGQAAFADMVDYLNRKVPMYPCFFIQSFDHWQSAWGVGQDEGKELHTVPFAQQAAQNSCVRAALLIWAFKVLFSLSKTGEPSQLVMNKTNTKNRYRMTIPFFENGPLFGLKAIAHKIMVSIQLLLPSLDDLFQLLGLIVRQFQGKSWEGRRVFRIRELVSLIITSVGKDANAVRGSHLIEQARGTCPAIVEGKALQSPEDRLRFLPKSRVSAIDVPEQQ
jgi:hypothetical protein